VSPARFHDSSFRAHPSVYSAFDNPGRPRSRPIEPDLAPRLWPGLPERPLVGAALLQVGGGVSDGRRVRVGHSGGAGPGLG
jgi:hypothetical protein